MKSTKHKSSTLYPWLIIILASLMLFYKYLLQVFPSVITDALMRDFQLTGTGLGNLAACFFYSYLIMQFFSGYLIDRFNLKFMIIFSIVLSACGALLFASSDNFNIAMLGRACMGAGAAFATVGYMKTAAIYFPASRFAFVSGLLTVGVMLGAVFGQAPLALLIQTTGWHLALVYVAAAGGVISLLFFIFIQNKPVTHHSILLQTPRSIKISDLIELIKNKSNWYLTFYSGLAFAPLAVFGGLWGTPFIIKAYNLTPASASLYVSMVYVGFGIGGPLFGFLSDRFGHRFRFMTGGLFLSFITLVTIIYGMPSIPWLVTCTLLFGLGTGGFMLGFSVGKDINPIFIAATVVAFINSGDAICGALSEPLIGKILDLNSHSIGVPTHFPLAAYHLAFIVLPVELLLAYGFLRLIHRSVLARGERSAPTTAISGECDPKQSA